MFSHQVATYLDRVLSSVLSGVWISSFSLLLLSLLPQFEFVCPLYATRTAVIAAALTISGLGARCFAAKTASLLSLEVWLKAGRRLLKWSVGCLVVAYSLLFAGGYGFLLYAWLIDTHPSEPRSTLFRRGRAAIQLRPVGPEMYNSPRPGAIVVQPLLPFFNLLNNLPDGQPDSTWTPTMSLQDLAPALAKQWQVALLTEARANRQYNQQHAAEQRKAAQPVQ